MTGSNEKRSDITADDVLRRHLEETERERDTAHRALQEREAELARIQRIALVGGLEIDFREGVKNRRSPEYLLVHGLPPEATNETYENWVARIHPDDRDATVGQLFDVAQERQRGLRGQLQDHPAE